MYVPMRGLGVILSGEGQHTMRQAKEAMPDCYSLEFDQCLNTEGGTNYPNCALFNKAYELDPDTMQAQVEQVPFCPQPRPCPTLSCAPCPTTECPPAPTCPEPTTTAAMAPSKTSWGLLALVAAGGLAVGYIVKG